MREIIFRRCRIEIESDQVTVYVIDCDAPPQVGYIEDPNTLNNFIARAFIADCLDLPINHPTVEANYKDEALTDFGVWAEMARIWYDRLRKGWTLWPHDRPVDARTVTGFLGSAILADHRDGDGNAAVNETNVGRGD